MRVGQQATCVLDGEDQPLQGMQTMETQLAPLFLPQQQDLLQSVPLGQQWNPPMQQQQPLHEPQWGQRQEQQQLSEGQQQLWQEQQEQVQGQQQVLSQQQQQRLQHAELCLAGGVANTLQSSIGIGPASGSASLHVPNSSVAGSTMPAHMPTAVAALGCQDECVLSATADMLADQAPLQLSTGVGAAGFVLGQQQAQLFLEVQQKEGQDWQMQQHQEQQQGQQQQGQTLPQLQQQRYPPQQQQQLQAQHLQRQGVLVQEGVVEAMEPEWDPDAALLQLKWQAQQMQIETYALRSLVQVTKVTAVAYKDKVRELLRLRRVQRGEEEGGQGGTRGAS